MKLLVVTVLLLTISGLEVGYGVEGCPKERAVGVLAAHLSVVYPDLATPGLKTKTIPPLKPESPSKGLEWETCLGWALADLSLEATTQYWGPAEKDGCFCVPRSLAPEAGRGDEPAEPVLSVPADRDQLWQKPGGEGQGPRSLGQAK